MSDKNVGHTISRGFMTKKKIGPRHEPFGRPTKYRPKFCKMLIDHMASGLSYECFPGLIDVAEQTIHNWELQHPDFLEAKKSAFAKSRMFWEKAGIEGTWIKDGERKLNSSAWIFNMKNRFNWTDRQEIQQTNDLNITVKNEFAKLSSEELIKIANTPDIIDLDDSEEDED